ncbi:MAG: glycosyltransferase family 2 protein [Rikenellaceae bacterium]
MESNKAILILNWNGEQHLATFLPSVLAHTPSTIDVIVADNGSDDSSLELLRRDFERVKIIEFDRNYGFAEGYNRAMELVEHEFVVLLNSDVEVSAGWCEPLFEALAADSSLAAVAPKLLSYCDKSSFEYAGAAGGFIDYLGYPFCRGRILQTFEQDRGQYDDMRRLFWISGAAFVCRRSYFREVGGFDADFFAHMEEIDLCWRFAMVGYSVAIVPQSTVYHLGGGTLNASSPRKTELNHRNNLAMLFKCAPTSQRIVVAVVRPMLDFVAALSYLIKGEWGNFVAVFKAYRTFFAWHSTLSKKRRAIRNSRKCEAKHIYRGSIVLRSLFGRRTFGSLKL